jgi:hypothetical protein
VADEAARERESDVEGWLSGRDRVMVEMGSFDSRVRMRLFDGEGFVRFRQWLRWPQSSKDNTRFVVNRFDNAIADFELGRNTPAAM